MGIRRKNGGKVHQGKKQNAFLLNPVSQASSSSLARSEYRTNIFFHYSPGRIKIYLVKTREESCDNNSL